ncbi:class I adenylate-forming enzyme family protein [Sporichthya brevicatena]|uniref:Class I adenylate-forming enzyme family protein n=1 Tax=Sporichthya brevicatena TaxID=171442 RepID=A0ABN1HAY5_9ACTN
MSALETDAPVAAPPAWGTEVRRRTGRHPEYLVWEPRKHRLSELLADSEFWGDREFLVQGERRVSFAEHGLLVDRACRELRRHGVGVGDRVFLLSGNHVETIVLWWAAQCVGALPVLGNSWWSEADVATAIDELTPRLVVTDGKRRGSVPAAVPTFLLEELCPAEGEAPRDWDETGDEDDPATVIFTSGTTGRPRGVVLSHRAVIANVHNLLHDTGSLPQTIGPERPIQISMLGVPFFHLSGLQSVVIALVTGGRLVFPPPGPFDAKATLELMAAERLTFFAAVPTVMGRLVNHPDFGNYDFSSIRAATMGGMAVPPALVERVRAAFPNVKRNVSTMYGLSETGGAVTRCSGPALAERPWSSGAPLPVVEVRIVDADAEGVGEIEVRSPANMTGYWDGSHTALVDPDGWLRTGDRGRLRDGHLELVGRSKDVVIRAGENIAAPHVEAGLLRHPAVAEVAVVGLPHPDLGEQVAAAVVPADGADVSVDDLRDFARAQLSSFEVPSAWWIRNEPLPTNAGGKVLKSELLRTWPSAG